MKLVRRLAANGAEDEKLKEPTIYIIGRFVHEHLLVTVLTRLKAR
jgi:hypothetical protein